MTGLDAHSGDSDVPKPFTSTQGHTPEYLLGVLQYLKERSEHGLNPHGLKKALEKVNIQRVLYHELLAHEGKLQEASGREGIVSVEITKRGISITEE